MPQTTYSELEQAINQTIRAVTTRDRRIGNDVLAGLHEQFSPVDVAGILLVSLERLLRLDPDALVWAIEQLLPPDLVMEIRRLTTTTVGRQLVYRGFVPGQDFSVDSTGRLLLSEAARQTIIP